MGQHRSLARELCIAIAIFFVGVFAAGVVLAIEKSGTAAHTESCNPGEVKTISEATKGAVPKVSTSVCYVRDSAGQPVATASAVGDRKCQLSKPDRCVVQHCLPQDLLRSGKQGTCHVVSCRGGNDTDCLRQSVAIAQGEGAVGIVKKTLLDDSKTAALAAGTSGPINGNEFLTQVLDPKVASQIREGATGDKNAIDKINELANAISKGAPPCSGADCKPTLVLNDNLVKEQVRLQPPIGPVAPGPQNPNNPNDRPTLKLPGGQGKSPPPTPAPNAPKVIPQSFPQQCTPQAQPPPSACPGGTWQQHMPPPMSQTPGSPPTPPGCPVWTCSAPKPTPDIILVTDPKPPKVESGKTINIGWITKAMSGCTIASEQHKEWSEEQKKYKNKNGVAKTPEIKEESTFVLTCDIEGGGQMKKEVKVEVEGGTTANASQAAAAASATGALPPLHQSSCPDGSSTGPATPSVTLSMSNKAQHQAIMSRISSCPNACYDLVVTLSVNLGAGSPDLVVQTSSRDMCNPATSANLAKSNRGCGAGQIHPRISVAMKELAFGGTVYVKGRTISDKSRCSADINNILNSALNKETFEAKDLESALNKLSALPAAPTTPLPTATNQALSAALQQQGLDSVTADKLVAADRASVINALKGDGEALKKAADKAGVTLNDDIYKKIAKLAPPAGPKTPGPDRPSGPTGPTAPSQPDNTGFKFPNIEKDPSNTDVFAWARHLLGMDKPPDPPPIFQPQPGQQTCATPPPEKCKDGTWEPVRQSASAAQPNQSAQPNPSQPLGVMNCPTAWRCVKSRIVSFASVPEKPASGTSVNLGWFTEGDVKSCTISSPSLPAWTKENATYANTNGAVKSPALTVETPFVLECTLANGVKEKKELLVDVQ